MCIRDRPSRRALGGNLGRFVDDQQMAVFVEKVESQGWRSVVKEITTRFRCPANAFLQDTHGMPDNYFGGLLFQSWMVSSETSFEEGAPSVLRPR